MRSPLTVAALALAYTELAEPCEGADDLSLLAKIAADIATEADWEVIAALSKPAALPAIAAELNAVDPVRAEALFHAWPPDSPQPPGAWQEPYSGRRWREVEDAMDTLRELGLTASRAEVERVAAAAWEHVER